MDPVAAVMYEMELYGNISGSGFCLDFESVYRTAL